MVRPNLDSRSIVFDPLHKDIIYEGGQDGVFKSIDGGKTWRVVNNGLSNVSVNFLAIDPVTTATIYAGTAAGIFKSNNGGNSWTEIDGGIPDAADDQGNRARKIVTLAVNPATPSIIYAGSYSGGMFYSIDSGNSWTQIGQSLKNGYIQSIVIDAKTPSTIFTSLGYGGIYKSIDAGATWIESDAGIGFPQIYSLAIDPADSTRIFAAGYVGIYLSTDSGTTWTQISNGPNYSVYGFAFDPTDHTVIYAASQVRVQKSVDGGASWASLSGEGYPPDFLTISSIVVSPFPPYSIYAGTGFGQTVPGTGVYNSLDRGATWSQVNTGPVISAALPATLALGVSPPTTLYASAIAPYSPTKIAASTDAGQTWVTIATSYFLSALTVDPTSSTTLYAASGQEIRKSIDGGITWTTLFTGAAGERFSAIAVDPTNSMNVYASALLSGIYKSVDGGASWNNILQLADINTLTINPLISNSLFAGGNSGFFASSFDSGATWITNTQGIPDYFNTYSINFDVSNPDTLFVSGYYGSYKSMDRGASWTRFDNGFPNAVISGLAQNPAQPQMIYAATAQGLYSTADGGISWSKYGSGLPEKVSFSSVALKPGKPSILIAGSYLGRFYTTDPAAAGAPTPASGWWWNPAEPGRGVGLDISAAGAARLGLFGFDDSGFSHWWTASGALDSSGNFTSNLIDAEFGSALGAPQRAAQTSSAGSISFAPISDTAGTLTLPNGSQVPIQRYEFTPGGLAAAADSAAPRTGWWTSPNAPGQYFFIEVQNGVINASALSFDVDGAPVWYSDRTKAVASGIYGGSWQELIGGQTLSSPYRAPKALANAASASLRFSSPTSGSLIFGTTILPITWTGP